MPKVKFVQIAAYSVDLGDRVRQVLIALSDKGEIWANGVDGENRWSKIESPNEE